MALLFDSLCAAALFIAAILAWEAAEKMPAAARLNLRFAALMLTGFSAARTFPNATLALDAALLTSSLATAASVLVLSFPRRAPFWISSLILLAAFAAGLLAALRTLPALALGYQAGAAAMLFAWSLPRLGENAYAAFLTILAAASLLFAAMTVMNGSLGAAMLFYATFLLLVTRASQTTVANRRRRGCLLVSGEHA